METKICPICGIEKPISEYHSYYSKERQKHRIGNYCKPCARINANERAKIHFQNNREAKLQYSRDYRADEKNKEKLKVLSIRFKQKYREELQDCYVRDRLSMENNIPTSYSRLNPEIVEAKRLQIKIKRKLKSLQDGKE